MEEVIGSIPLGSTIFSLSFDPASLDRRERDLRCLRGAAFGVLCVIAILTGSGRVCADGLVAPQPGTEPTAPPAVAALVDELRNRIVRSDSATAVLESWCGEKGLSRQARLVALRDTAVDKAPTAEQRVRLGVGPNEPVRYRHVRLACGARVLSKADNWYVPSRLTPEMNAALDGTDTPFGRVVRPLGPVRRVVAVRPFPLPAAPNPDTPLVQVDAVLVTGAGAPFCEVVETYLGAALPGIGVAAQPDGDTP